MSHQAVLAANRLLFQVGSGEAGVSPGGDTLRFAWISS